MEGDGGGAHPECGIGVLNGAEYEIVFLEVRKIRVERCGNDLAVLQL